MHEATSSCVSPRSGLDSGQGRQPLPAMSPPGQVVIDQAPDSCKPRYHLVTLSSTTRERLGRSRKGVPIARRARRPASDAVASVADNNYSGK